jgi:hypothetical protein
VSPTRRALDNRTRVELARLEWGVLKPSAYFADDCCKTTHPAGSLVFDAAENNSHNRLLINNLQIMIHRIKIRHALCIYLITPGSKRWPALATWIIRKAFRPTVLVGRPFSCAHCSFPHSSLSLKPSPPICRELAFARLPAEDRAAIVAAPTIHQRQTVRRPSCGKQGSPVTRLT